jgi:glycosyltransferase involved in cell wall biosynthesis
MRIAYVAPYQGPELVKKRPTLHNLSLAARVKIQLIAELLHRNSHDVEIISQGDVDTFQCRYYAPFAESERFHPDIPIYYASAFPVRYVSGFWESAAVRRLLQARHDVRPYDLVLIYNMKRGQNGCAHYATRRLGLPVVLEYEDDSFVNVHGRAGTGLIQKYHRYACAKVLRTVSAGTGVSPYLMAQFSSSTPTILLRGVVSNEIVRLSQEADTNRRNRVVFSGTHEGTQGLEQMIKAWRMLQPPGWELHIAGKGPLTPTLEKLAEGASSIVFSGLLNREQNARLLCSARIGLNPQDVTHVPGNVFPFKIIEYLAAGLHVLSTFRGTLEPELEAGVTYIQDNDPSAIAAGLKQVIESGQRDTAAQRAAMGRYGPEAVSQSLDWLINQTRRHTTQP